MYARLCSWPLTFKLRDPMPFQYPNHGFRLDRAQDLSPSECDRARDAVEEACARFATSRPSR